MNQHNQLDTAMVLAAGLGTRMRPITDTLPKPLVKVCEKTLLDHALDAVESGGIGKAIVNIHYLADQIEAHLDSRSSPAISVSNEREALLDSGGGAKKALAGTPDGPVLILNADSFWVDGSTPNSLRMKELWDAHKMDMLLMVAQGDQAVGFDGAGDFFMNKDGQLTRRGQAVSAPYIYAGAIITTSQYIRVIEDDTFSMNRLFDLAISQNRLYGCRLDGLWLHVGTPASIAEAEQAVEQFTSLRQHLSDTSDE